MSQRYNSETASDKSKIVAMLSYVHDVATCDIQLQLIKTIPLETKSNYTFAPVTLQARLYKRHLCLPTGSKCYGRCNKLIGQNRNM